MSQRPRAIAVDGPVVDGPAIVNGGVQHREAGVSEVSMDVGFSDIGEPLAPTTTITTVAVQAGKAKIVLAILKVRPSSMHADDTTSLYIYILIIIIIIIIIKIFKVA